MDKIIVAEDGFAIVCRRLIPRLSTGNHFLFAEIAEIEADLPLTQFDDMSNNISSLEQSYTRIIENTILVKRKDGQVKKVTFKIYRGAVKEALSHIKKLSPIRIVINDPARP